MRNVVELAAVMLLPTLLGYSVLAVPRVLRWWRARHRSHLLAMQPIERLAEDVRRLHRQLADYETRLPGPGRRVRISALRAAYVDALHAACQALDVPPPHRRGGQVPTSEIFRVEAALRLRGLNVTTPVAR